MIAVIADDFTGAAELGGIGLRHGLSVVISTETGASTDADLLVIDADTRSVDETQAVKTIDTITRNLVKQKPEFIYKKTDSVLRGHIVAELKAQLKVLGFSKALLVAPNPDLGRTIKNGIYFFNGEPVHESSFSNDPEFGIISSDVYKMLQADRHDLQVIAKNDPMPSSGIMVGEAGEMDDLSFWATRCGKDILPAGAAGFFSAILDARKINGGRKINPEPVGGRSLYVCGTTFNESREAIGKIAKEGGPVSYLPDAEYKLWYERIRQQLDTYGKVIVAIDPEREYEDALSLRERMAMVVEKLLRSVTIGELIIEGGSTARAVLTKLKYKNFFPVCELATGVVRMKVKEQPGIFVTVKPGSYTWPAGTWNF